MAASKLSSPTANLYRTSRLFSLPPPLPRPAYDILPNNSTATLPYPTHAAIQTTQASLSRGDWGLKCALPTRKLTNVKEPTIRAISIDELGGFSDFESSSDHVQSLRKFQAMSIPMVREQKGTGSYRAPGRSAFEEENRDLRSSRTISSPSATKPRAAQASEPDALGSWKHAGPNLVDLDAFQFDDFMSKAKTRRAAFQRFLKDKALQKRDGLMKQLAREQRLLPSRDRHQISDEAAFREYLGSLGKHEMDHLVEQFFELKPPPGLNDESASPSIHPSGGLSYLRATSAVTNHPYYGPQEFSEPVEARVLSAQGAPFNGSKRGERAQAGVGGFVTVDSEIRSSEREYNTPVVAEFDHKKSGGGKFEVTPMSASLDVNGRVIVSIERASQNSVNVKNLKEYRERQTSGSIPRTYDSLPDLSAPVKVRKGVVNKNANARMQPPLQARSAGSKIANSAVFTEHYARLLKQQETQQGEENKTADTTAAGSRVKLTESELAGAAARLAQLDEERE